MFLRLFATFIVTLFFGVGNTIKEVPQRVLQPKFTTSYSYDSNTQDAIYEFGQYDNPFTYFMVTQNLGYQGLDMDTAYDYTNHRAFIGFVTICYEGIVDYFYTDVNDDYIVLIEDLCTIVGEHWTSLDFFTFDIIDYEWNQTAKFRSWQRYYGVGEQHLKNTCFFEDNFNQCFTSDYHYLHVNTNVFEMPSQQIGTYTQTNFDAYFTRAYTELVPSLINPFSLFFGYEYEAFVFPFNVVVQLYRTLETPNFNSSIPFNSSYKLRLGCNVASSETSYSSGYKAGYEVGHQEGYDEGSDVADSELNDKYNEGYGDGYDEGYDSAYDDYYDTRYTEGYNQGVYDESQLSNKYTFANLFGALADTPIMILRSLLGFDVFGVNAMTILMSMVTACIALFVIRKII